ncbi:MAG TPA: LTA synthase family protein [Burkholderiales bacterium]
MNAVLQNLRNRLAAGFGGRFYPVALVYAMTFAVGLGTRVALLARPDTQGIGGVLAGAEAFVTGAFFDAVVATYFVLPLALWLALAPSGLVRSRAHRALVVVGVAAYAYLLLWVAIAEWLFWDEFGARFNFIAVDYLIYTREVLGNILESYPVGKLMSAAAAGAAVVAAGLAPSIWRRIGRDATRGARLGPAGAVAAAAALAIAFVSTSARTDPGGDTARELGGNGIYQFFAAFRANSLDFPVFYATRPEAEASAFVRTRLTAAGERWPARPESSVERLVIDKAPEKRLNVVLVSEESLGAEFLGTFGNPRGLTPRLDALARESLLFTNVYATGNRTVRGLEALSLAIPPTPGESIVKRPGAEGLFTLGSVFENRGYEALFVYGGYGYFDNMNAYFEANDYRAVDRTMIPKERIHHENIWGVADEDLFDFAIEQFDRAYADGRPFFAHVMTTSNHRPYTYPDGRIDIPSGSGRDGAVKYSDWAIGHFIDEAKKHPWFGDTLFVLTADHGANARGTLDIPVAQYRIPLLFYAPKHIEPGRVERLMSQIDIAPTLLGQLHFSYRTKFFGHDLFATPPSEDRAFVANYQTLGYLRDGRLVTLMPQRRVRIAPYPVGGGAPALTEEKLRDEAIAWYQLAFEAYRSRALAGDRSNREPPSAGMIRIAQPPER